MGIDPFELLLIFDGIQVYSFLIGILPVDIMRLKCFGSLLLVSEYEVDPKVDIIRDIFAFQSFPMLDDELLWLL